MHKPERKRRARTTDRRVRLHFLGAARTVTGSLHFFEVSDGDKTVRFFCDMGLDQEQPARNRQNRLPSGVKWSEIAFGIASHTHIDHIGAIPFAVKNGFNGKIYATQVTCELAAVLLQDCGYLQEEEAKRLSKRNNKRCAQAAKDNRNLKGCGEGETVVEPLYTEEDALASLKHFEPVEFNTSLKIADGITIRFTLASHILGAAVVTLELGNGAKKRRVVFSGDLGRPDMPVLKDLAPVKQADYVICEGTYGDRLHPKRDRQAALAEIINRAYERAKIADRKYGHGVIIIPAFAVGRVQSVLYDLRQMMAENKIPNVPVFVDSPMAIRATHIYRSHPELYNAKAAKMLTKGGDIFRTPRFAELEHWQQSIKLDEPAKEPIIVVGSSGMAAGGRIMRHLQKRLPGKQNTVVFIGYQGLGTLGRQLTTPNVTEAKVFGDTVPVRATIEHMEDYSGHADYSDIVRWLRGIQVKPKKLFLVHGDEESLTALEQHIESTLGWDVEIPRLREYIDLE